LACSSLSRKGNDATLYGGSGLPLRSRSGMIARRPPALHCTALHCTALHCTALHCTALHCTALHCTALHCTRWPALHCIERHYIVHWLKPLLKADISLNACVKCAALKCTVLLYCVASAYVDDEAKARHPAPSMHSTAPHRTALHCTALHCTALLL
jgi:hypothetical protein